MKQTEISRVLRAVKAAGVTIGKIQVSRDEIVVFTSADFDNDGAKAVAQWERDANVHKA